mgnify:CR=1 FL=1
MIVVIRGAGDLATGIALRLYRSGYQLVMTDLPEPTAIRRTVCFSEAIRQGEMEVEGVQAVCCTDAQNARNRVEQGLVAVLGDSAGACIPALKPGAVVDAILAKKNLGTAITDAPVVIGVGIGGDFEKCALLAKEALCRPLSRRNPNPDYAALEQELLEKINALDIGPQGFGGQTTALGVNIETYATHIAGLPVAVNVGCHVTRHATKEL